MRAILILTVAAMSGLTAFSASAQAPMRGAGGRGFINPPRVHVQAGASARSSAWATSSGRSYVGGYGRGAADARFRGRQDRFDRRVVLGSGGGYGGQGRYDGYGRYGYAPQSWSSYGSAGGYTGYSSFPGYATGSGYSYGYSYGRGGDYGGVGDARYVGGGYGYEDAPAYPCGCRY